MTHGPTTNTAPPLSQRRAHAGFPAPAILAMAVICLIVELALSGNAIGLWGQGDWRRLAIEYGGFWAGLLGNWQPNYAVQPEAMFLTYAFLHSGPWHFLVNTLTLFALGDIVAQRIGQTRFVLLYLGSAVGGAVAFAVLVPSALPMVGASGALFGLFGAILAWNALDGPTGPDRAFYVLKAVVLLVVLNLVLWWAMHGQLAWQTHLGGFLAGSGLALAMDRV